MFRLITCFFLSLCCLAFAGCGKEASAPSGKDYERIVVVSDLHYPSKATDDAKRQAIIDNKVKARGTLEMHPFCLRHLPRRGRFALRLL